MTVTINGTTGVAGVDGTASTPAIQGNDTNTGIFFPAADTIAFAEGGAEVARFDSSGNLNLGATTNRASSKLDVRGDSITLGTNATYYGTFGYDAGTGYLSLASENGGGTVFKSGTTERMRIDTSGNLLLGSTNSPAYAKFLIVQAASDPYARLARFETVNSGTIEAIQFIKNSGGLAQVGSITMTTSATAYNTSSDYRLKENVAPMTGALAKVSALKPVTYTWKESGEASQGFIAHELQEVVPECVTGEKDAVNEDGTIKAQGIDTSFLVATLTAAIQEQQAIITDLKARIETLENK
jgi:hypothetical protein